MSPDQLDFTEMAPMTVADVKGRLAYALDPLDDDHLIAINGAPFAAEELRFLLTKISEEN